MSDLDKLFENAPEGAVAIKRTKQGKMFFINKDGDYYHGGWKPEFCDKWKTIATRPQSEQPRKTVEDAVEWNNGKWINDVFTHIKCRNNMLFYASDDYLELDGCSYLVCTREQFKACVATKDKSEPEWTHQTSLGKCRVLIDTPDQHGYVVIEHEEDGYSLVPPRALKHIKPTITPAEAWDMMSDYCGALSLEEFFHELQTEYNITN